LRARRLVLVLAMACLPLVAGVGTAGAVPPIRTCPPPFQGPLTFQQVLDEFPPPPEIPPEVIEAAFDFFDKNDDGNLCVKGLPNGVINVIDNAANVP
jgi:hypothetical protein